MLTRLTISHQRHSRSTRLLIVGAVGILAIVLGSFGTWRAYTQAEKHNLNPGAGFKKTQTVSSHTTTTTQLAISANTASASPATTPNQTAATPNKPTTPTPKYSISSDPRSTAYSTTPPTPNVADFTTTITHNGQVTPGTLISYNAEKNAKVYYGGDLRFSNNGTVSITQQYGNRSTPFTVSTPDSAQANMPAMPWNDQSPVAFVATDGSAGPGTSWSMFVELIGTQTPRVAPYTIHLQTFQLGGGDIVYEYDGFLSLYIGG